MSSPPRRVAGWLQPGFENDRVVDAPEPMQALTSALAERAIAEAIVRALATADPTTDDPSWWECGLCDKALPATPDDHMADCPWRLAVEWVRSHGG